MARAAVKRLRKISLWILGIAAGAAALALAAFYVAPASLLLSGAAEAIAKQRLGRGLSFTGAVERRLYPTLGADFTEVAIANAPGAGPAPLLWAERVSIDLDPAAALDGEIRILSVTILRPVLRATIDESGAPNWLLGPERRTPQNALEEIAEAERMARDIARRLTEPAPGAADASALPLKTRIEGGRILFEDRRSGRGAELTAFNLAADLDETGALRLEGASNVNGRPTKLSARLPDPFALLAGRADAARFAYEGEGVRLTFNGAFDLRKESLSAKGDVTGRLSGDRELTAWLRQGLPSQLDALGAVLLDGTLEADRGKLDLAMKGTGEFNGAALDATLTARGGADWRRGQPIETFLAASAGGLAKADARGRLTIRDDAFETFDGRVSASSPDWGAVRRWAGVSAPPRPVGAIRIDGALKAGRSSFELSDAALKVAQAQARAALSLDWSGARLRVNGSLRDGPLDLLAFAPGRRQPALRRLAASDGSEVSTPPAAPTPDPEAPLAGEGEIAALAPPDAWSTTRLPVELLDQAEGLFSIDLKGAAFGEVNLGATDVDLKLGDGGVTLDMARIALYGGALSGSARLAKSGDGAAFATNLTLSGVETEKFLAALGRDNWLRGPIEASAAVTGAGASVSALMRSLQGRGSAEMKNGSVLAINFAAAALDRRLALFGARQVEAGVTPFTRASLPFTIEKGVARTESLRVEGNVVRAKGEGEVDIGARRIDATITPTGFGAISFLGIDAAIARAFPVRMLGPWSAVRVFLDRDRGADMRLKREN